MIAHRPKRKIRKSQKNRSRSKPSDQGADKKTFVEVIQMLQVKLPKLNGSSPEEYWAYRSRFEQEVLRTSMHPQVKLNRLFDLCDTKVKRYITHCMGLPKKEGLTTAQVEAVRSEVPPPPLFK